MEKAEASTVRTQQALLFISLPRGGRMICYSSFQAVGLSSGTLWTLLCRRGSACKHCWELRRLALCSFISHAPPLEVALRALDSTGIW
jgi:hypothetical protein